MTKHVLQVIDGPDKPALQWALSDPAQEQVHFLLDYDGVDARILRMDEMADGFDFKIQGILVSGIYKSMPFTALYCVGSRSGQITIDQ